MKIIFRIAITAVVAAVALLSVNQWIAAKQLAEAASVEMPVATAREAMEKVKDGVGIRDLSDDEQALVNSIDKSFEEHWDTQTETIYVGKPTEDSPIGIGIGIGPEKVLATITLNDDGSRTETSFQDDGTSYSIHYDSSGSLAYIEGYDAEGNLLTKNLY